MKKGKIEGNKWSWQINFSKIKSVKWRWEKQIKGWSVTECGGRHSLTKTFLLKRERGGCRSNRKGGPPELGKPEDQGIMGPRAWKTKSRILRRDQIQ